MPYSSLPDKVQQLLPHGSQDDIALVEAFMLTGCQHHGMGGAST
jgi:hypothetical protein